ncbi:MAG TPA: acyl-CoA dehydrogenase [Naasia sp.]|jgi:acyl-CoA oxidase
MTTLTEQSDAPVIPVPDALKVDVAALGERLLGRWSAERMRARDLIRTQPQLHRVDGLGMEEHRERVLHQLGLLVEGGMVVPGFPVSVGGEGQPTGNVAAFEELLLADPSLQIKAGVQWGLFASAIYFLGNDEQHKRWLPGTFTLDVPGAFAMTETGHGSDVASIGTTATFDESTGDFVLHTPFRAAWKDYLGNAAQHGKAAVVFAQLITRGVNHGVHCFYVPLRDESGAFLPGVGGEDDGLKGGLNGVDNGRLHFTGVRVPRTNLLDRYGSVDEGGAYTSSIASPGRRFFTMLGTLVQGRVMLDGASTRAAQLALHIAITYATQRRQFAGGSGEEIVLMDYQRHQRRLIPRLAQTYAMAFAHEELLAHLDRVFTDPAVADEIREDLETRAAALKPLSTWAGLEILQEAREACGGAGYLAQNRLAGLRADTDIYVTFEGDNNVLLQLVGKRLLTDYGKRFGKADTATKARYVATMFEEAGLNRSGLRQVGQRFADFGSTARSVGQVRDAAAQRQLLTDRVETMVAGLAARLRPASKLDPAAAQALFNANQNELIEAAQAHGELLQWEAFTAAVERTEDADTKQVLTWLRDLFGLGLIEKHASWYLITGRLAGPRAQAITDYIDDRLLPRLRPHLLDLVAAFRLAPEHIRAEIATGAERTRQDEARDHLAALAASGAAPILEKSLTKKR